MMRKTYFLIVFALLSFNSHIYAACSPLAQNYQDFIQSVLGVNIQSGDDYATNLVDLLCDIRTTQTLADSCTFITQADVPYTINKSGNYCVADDLFSSALGNMITINADNVNLNLNGHLLDANGFGYLSAGILVNSGIQNTTVHNGSIINFSYAIRASELLLANFSNLNISSSGYGIDIETTLTSTGISIENCFLNGCYDGINLKGVSGFSVENVISKLTSGDYSFQFDTCDDGVVRNCTSVFESPGDNTRGFSILSPNIVFEDCAAIGHDLEGFIILNSSNINNVFINCKSINNLSSGFSTYAPGTVFRECTASGNESNGFIIQSGADNSVLEDCIADSNAGHGFSNVAYYVTINNCTASNNSLDGFSSSGFYNTYIECVANKNTVHGFYTSAHDNIFSRCIANKNSNGFYLDTGGYNTVLEDCIGKTNTNNGFYLGDSNAIVRDCSASVNGLDGFALTSVYSADITISNCVANRNSSNGFNVSNSNNLIRDCSSSNNTSAGFRGTGATNLTVCNNIANANTGGDYVDVTDSNLCSSISAVQTSIDNCCPCDYFITQVDIPYTINSPGNYCLAESIVGSGTSITISSSNVTLDLKDRTINGGTTGIVLSTGVANVKVINGSIFNNDWAGLWSEGVITVTTDLYSSTNWVSSIELNNLHVKDSIFGYSFKLTRTATIVDCVAERCGPGFAFPSNVMDPATISDVSQNVNFILENCTAQDCRPVSPSLAALAEFGSPGYGGQGFSLLYSKAELNRLFYFNNCKAIGCTREGFYLGMKTLVLDNCIASYNGLAGFSIKTLGNNSTIRNCISDYNDQGFEDGGGNLYKNNSAQHNNKQGFCSSSTIPSVFLSNIAINNNGKGGSVDMEIIFPPDSYYPVFNNFAGSYSSGVSLVVSSTSVTSSTGYWTNVST